MILREDLDRLQKLQEPIRIERSLRRQEGILSYRMMRTLTNEIRRLQKANQYLCKKLREATGKSMDTILMETKSGPFTSTNQTEKVKESKD